MSPPSIPQLQAFLAVARCEHVTRAAEELGLSQPAISHQLRALEGVLGLPLVERVGRGIRLTGEARALLPSAAAAYAGMVAMTDVAAAARGLDQGSLVLAASNTVGIYRLPDWLAGFVKRHPLLQITVRMVNTAVAAEMLRASSVDVALVEGSCSIDGLDQVIVEHDEVVVVAGASHELAASAPIALAELAGHRYLARENGSGTELLAATMLAEHYRRGPVLELDQVDAVRAGVLAGLGYAVLPTVAIAEDLRTGRVVSLTARDASVTRELRALRRSSARGPALEAFWQHLQTLASTSRCATSPAP